MIDHPGTHEHPLEQSASDTQPNSRRAMLAGIGGLAAGAFLTGKANAGPLMPPPGPIQATPGPEPRTPINATNTPGTGTALFRITQPGSYYLTGNITGESGKNGIEIATSGVTIDLMGFDLAGVPGSLAGIFGSGNLFRNIVVLNGSVRDWGGTGVELAFGPTGSSENGRVERVNAQGNGSFGISAGRAFAVANCAASGNGLHGFLTDRCCTINDCTALGNGGRGIRAGSGCTITNCTAFSNSFDGIDAASSCTITNCTARSNDRIGINTLDRCAITNCVSNTNGRDGISTTDACTITNCAAGNNVESGISTGETCVILNCVTIANINHGIEIPGYCSVRNNICREHTESGFGGGIRATGSGNRIEDNNCLENRLGIHCTSSGNFIARNTCADSISNNWFVVSNNRILVVNSASAGFVIGNSGGTSPGSTDPNANYSY